MANQLTRLLGRLGTVFGFEYGDTRPEDPRRTLHYLPLPVHAAGISLTMDEATQLSVTWACMDAITKGISSSRWNVYSEEAGNHELLPDDPNYWLLNVRPNPDMTAQAWKESMLYQAVSWGNSYSEIVRNRAGKPVQLWPLLSDRMVTTREVPEDGSTGELEYWYFQPYMGGWVKLRPSQVLHFRGPSINGLMGENMVARSAKSIAVAVAQERFVSAFFANGATLGTILKYPKTLSPDAHKRLKEDWEEKHQGPDKAHKPFILEGGMDIQVLGLDGEKLQLIDSRKFSVEEICRFFGVPLHKVQSIDRATFNNIEHLGLEFVRDSLKPWAKRFEQEVDFKLFPQKSPWRQTHFDMEWLTQGDAKSRWEAYQIGRRIGVLNANDILRKEGQNTIGPEGDIRLVEANMTTLEGIKALVDKTKAEAKNAKNPPPPPVPPPAGGDEEDAGGEGESKPPPPKEEPAKPQTNPRQLVQEAVVALWASVFERYQRKLHNRETDLRRKRSRSETEVNAALAELRIEAREGFWDEFKEGFDILGKLGPLPKEEKLRALVIRAADVVDSGKDPTDAAMLLLSMQEETR